MSAVICTEPLVKVDRVWFAYDGAPVIEDLSLCVNERVFVGIVGPNGGGKTTLMKLITGELRPGRGTVEVFGQPPQRLGRLRYLIGYVPQRQEVDWNFPASVREVVMMGGYARAGLLRPVGRATRRRADELLELLGMAEHAGERIGSLSVGQQQRAFIVRALVSEPKLLILDEPTVNVDSAGQQSFFELVLDLKRRFALTVLMVSHDIDQMAHYADQVACIARRVHFHDKAELLNEEVLEKVYACELDAFYARRAQLEADHAAGHPHLHGEEQG
jgi:zinc transport system ATP-binding protein